MSHPVKAAGQDGPGILKPMSAFKIACPFCQASLRSSKAPRLGKQVDCPQCLETFAIRADMIGASSGVSVPGVMLDALLAGEEVEQLRPPGNGTPAMGILVTPRKPAAEPIPAAAIMVDSAAAHGGDQPCRSPGGVACLSAKSPAGIGLAVGVGLVALVTAALAGSLLTRDKAPPSKIDSPSGDIAFVLRDSGTSHPSDPVPKKVEEEVKKSDDKGSGAKPDKGPAPVEEPKKAALEKKEPEPPREEIKPPVVKAIVKDEPGKKPDAKKDSTKFVGPATPGLPGLEPERINRSVLMGAAFLKRNQQATGTWSKGGHGVGYAALCGLTLLECRFHAGDTNIQRAAAYVRSHAAKLDETYDLSLAVLFLDRLGDSRDKILIQGMALRLVAGQTDKGGWDYRCPLLSSQEMYQLFAYLQTTQPKVALQLPRKDETSDSSFQPPRDESFFKQLEGDYKPVASPKGPDYKKIDLGPKKDGSKVEPKKGDVAVGRKKDDKTDVVKKEDKAPRKEDAGKPPPKVKAEAPPPKFETLLPSLREVPAVAKDKGPMRAAGRDDNSNSQFAILALWAARRHGVPTEFTLQLAGARYETTQSADGGWGYQFGRGSSGPMTCAGLLGLAVGVGTAPAFPKVKPGGPGRDAKPFLDNASVDKGLMGLSSYLGNPSLTGDVDKLPNLYFLWSVERVAMMYDLKTIGGKDWYGWGAQTLIKHQNVDGSWSGGGYAGSNATIDTCLALLFLKRSNLADDLTRNFAHFLMIRDPGEK